MDHKNTTCNEAIYSKLYQDLNKAIWRFIYFKCGDQAQADDLVQDAFIKLWQNCQKVPKEKARSYLYTITNNAFLNEVAHKKVVLKHAKLKEHVVNNQSPEFLYEEKQFGVKIQDAIDNLTEAQRSAFLLNRIEGKKYAEIAEIFGISVKAVEKRMSQALKALRQEIKGI